MPDVINDLSQFAMPAFIVGIVVFILGFLLRGNAKKSVAVGFFSMLFLTIGADLILFAASTWFSGTVDDWNSFSGRMQR